ncbi:uncharacterized protein EAE97_002830 [Botrytis byssoidea]|uniref:Uncharacterized protein n=1 Tax=Botrytis byssoidea TaxID=139641 RepID=A0A9P5IRK4_9HELO|nr:uncharacterized protein EAE97_002830 [Botrytis byssoidea]KAF7949321.1 hypothetical protein EAE97_002830 [Botrytis byssoidea]
MSFKTIYEQLLNSVIRDGGRERQRKCQSLCLNVALLLSGHNQAVYAPSCGTGVFNNQAAVHSERIVNNEALLDVEFLWSLVLIRTIRTMTISE